MAPSDQRKRVQMNWCRDRHVLLFFAVLLAGQLAQVGAARGKTRLLPRIHGLWECKDKKQHATFYNYSIERTEDGDERIFLDWQLDKAIKLMSKLTVVIHRCVGAVSPNLCEYFSTWNWGLALCQLTAARNMLWSPIADNLTPRKFRCPIMADHYVLKNGTVDAFMLDKLATGAKFNLEKYIWQVESQLYDEDGELSICAKFDFELVRVRIRNETGSSSH